MTHSHSIISEKELDDAIIAFMEALQQHNNQITVDDDTKSTFKKNLSGYGDRITKGYKLILDHITASFALRPLTSSIAAYLPVKENLSVLQDKSKLIQSLAEGKSLAQICGFQEDAIMHFFQISSELLEKKQYESASDAFSFLTTICPQVSVFWQGLARSEALNQSYEAAFLAYKLSIVLDDESDSLYEEAITQFLELKQNDLAKELLAAASKALKTLPDDASRQMLAKVISNFEQKGLKLDQ